MQHAVFTIPLGIEVTYLAKGSELYRYGWFSIDAGGKRIFHYVEFGHEFRMPAPLGYVTIGGMTCYICSPEGTDMRLIVKE